MENLDKAGNLSTNPMVDETSTFSSRVNQLQSAQRLDSFRKQFLINSPVKGVELKESPWREQEQTNGGQSMAPPEQVNPEPQDKTMEFGSDSEMHDECQSPTRISKKTSLGRILSTNSDQGTC